MDITYNIEAGPSQGSVLNDGVSDCTQADTLAEAKRKARRMLSEEYARENEMSTRSRYAQIKREGSSEILWDFFA